ASPEPFETPPTPRDRGTASSQPARPEEQGGPGGGPRRRAGRGRDPDRGRGGTADGPSGRPPRSRFVPRFRPGRGAARPGPPFLESLAGLELLVQARKRFQERRFEAALTAAQEASRIAERTTDQLRRASWSYAVLAAQGLLDPCDPADPDTVKARALLDRARDVFFQGQTMDDAFLQDLVRAAEVAHAREADRVREL